MKEICPLRRVCAALVLMFCAACTTQVTPRATGPAPGGQALSIAGFEVVFAWTVAETAPFEAKIALEGALRQRMRPPRAAARPVDMRVVIDQARFATRDQRAVLGVFAGSDVLDVTVTLTDVETRALVSEFAVEGAYNPGGAGAYRNPVEAAANAVADAVAKRLGPALMDQPAPPGI
jgi:hypothetical protein